MDGLALYAVVNEINSLLEGKIEKVQQPERDTILLQVRCKGKSVKFLLCADAQNGRVQLTENIHENPKDAPAFCMLLRRRIVGGRIKGLVQQDMDRTLSIHIDSYDDFGELISYELIIELMGKHSNIILINSDNAIIGCSHNVTPIMSSVRLLMPGIKYVKAPQQAKSNPLFASTDDFYNAINSNGSIFKLIGNAFFGLSPASVSEIIANWSGETDLYSQSLSTEERQALSKYLFNQFQAFSQNKFDPTLIIDDVERPIGVYPFLPKQLHMYAKAVGSMSEAYDEYYKNRDIHERIKRNSSSISRILNNSLSRQNKKLAIYEQTLNSSEDLERLRLYGELLTANIYGLNHGISEAKLTNYYTDPPSECVVPLDKRLSPQKNAQNYFKSYQKRKIALSLATKQKEDTLREIEYIEGQLDNLSKCTSLEELLEIREELIKEGFIKPEKQKRKPPKQEPSTPYHFVSTDGANIYVGKNNKQNEELTLRFALSESMWLHVKNMPGSHVIVQQNTNDIGEQTLYEAAMLAAYFSSAKNSASVAVDYCMRKYVKKPAGAKPGYVIYINNKTIYVTPEELIVKKLTTKKEA